MKSKCFKVVLPLVFLAKTGSGLFLIPPLSGPLPLDANGFDEGPLVLGIPPKDPNGSLSLG